MKFVNRLKLAFSMLRQAKLRSWLTIIGIVIAVASVSMILSFSQGIKTEVNKKVDSSGAKSLDLYSGWSEEENSFISLNDYEELEKMQEVKSLLRENAIYVDLFYLDYNLSKRIKGLDMKNFDDFKSSYKLKQGEWLDEDSRGQIMVSFDFLNRSFEKDDMPVLYDYLEILGNNYQIIGIFESGGMFDFGEDKIITTFDDVLDLKQYRIDNKIGTEYYDWQNLDLPAGLLYEDIYEKIRIKINPDFEFDVAKKNIEKRLIQFRNSDRVDKNFWLSSQDAMLDEINQIINIVTWVLVGFASISILVGSVGIANTMFTSVLEKTKEIGILKSIGAKNSDIRSIFLLNSGLLGLAGGILGILIGISLALIAGFVIISYAKLGDINLFSLINFYVILGSLIFSILIGMFSGFLPAKNASRLKPVDALRYE